MRAWIQGLLLLLLLLVRPAPLSAELGVSALFHRGLAPVSLGDTPADQHSAAACGACHAEIVEEWSQSRHALAWTNGIFQREFKTRPLTWCVRCHAPLATGGASSVGVVEAEGVNCAVCHLRDGEMITTAASGRSPHRSKEVAGFDSEQMCAGCHQFAFPFVEPDGAVTRYTDHPMQDTVAEFLAGPHAERPGACLACHGQTPAGHLMPGAHSLGALQHAAVLDICRLQPSRSRARSPRTLRLAVTNIGAGHELPSGDLHRHLILRAWRPSAPMTAWDTFIGRAFEPAPDAGKVVRLHTSIAPLQTRSWDVPVGPLAGDEDEPIIVELRYVYTEDEIVSPRNDPGEPTSVVVHRRTLEPGAIPVCP